ncbi:MULTISPECIES: NAD(P)/FAD-dependent oxidoreductase [Vibrio]|uniref:NAD(P)/FAD-dependent oxidoreductase n=1 Tax=bacterium 19MO03SA05 TaxID=2920620 RepID=A0AAU6VG69_UNCXX|nr:MULTISPECIES: NAD(P)/FAD-dependent oxidoreductase [Vibrio]EKO3572548.1 NAD(P)/FAD-dependent oxidoreductase [Vibrio metschnikovii]EKO3637782.1 NAD(P)/FAD-dependent oxidoreductase [Vibrio metschnikovii]EKO3664596.1 NAD(P)/FAD-dependent oxidoreductase [Vibrio metschnikovii]EKO3667801.1 NAD(P)/FAD-dependent oxidoreductase [Vibrio metschnikovii]EKO3699341.1 NAD(P)/FAD-dependent oxidoreductase [Vibrio metschnikovii]
MKIAIIGSGISGLTCGHYLHQQHDVTIFEANDYIGGHTATVDVELNGQSYAIDTGFIVYNDRTYPNFIKMMNEIGVRGVATQMSFSVRNDANGLEYNGHTITTLFAQKRNWFKPSFYRFIREILRFNQLAKAAAADAEHSVQTLGEFLHHHQFSDYFCENYILPMGAAIWSSSLADMRAFPLTFFLRFFLNHGLLDITHRPQWYVIEGGSRAYIEPLTQGFRDKIRLNAPVEWLRRSGQGIELQVHGKIEHFDEVIFACHSDQALALLSDANHIERELLGAMGYQANEVILHTDTSLLPKRKAAWASWNYRLAGDVDQETRLPALTYNMNILQHIDSSETFCVTLNSSESINPNKVLRKFTYHHPVFNRAAIAAQQRKAEISGVNHTWFCGAYWHNGFHEDGVKSALDVVTRLSAQTNTAQQGAA